MDEWRQERQLVEIVAQVRQLELQLIQFLEFNGSRNVPEVQGRTQVEFIKIKFEKHDVHTS
jgi:hypothetical protein